MSFQSGLTREVSSSSGPVFLNARHNQLCSIVSYSNNFVCFEQLIIHETKLITPNTQHDFVLGIFGLAIDVDTPATFSPFPFLSSSGLSQWIHFSSSVIIRFIKPFSLCLARKIDFQNFSAIGPKNSISLLAN